MSFEVQCGQCAQRFAAAPHLAGKQVRCPGCGGAISVPLSADQAPIRAAMADSPPSFGPPPIVARTSASPWEVQCGQCAKRFAASEQLAGKHVRCPGCGGIITIPLTPPVNQTAPGSSFHADNSAHSGNQAYAGSSAYDAPYQAAVPAQFAGGYGSAGGDSRLDSATFGNATWQISESESGGLGGFLATHKMMLAVTCWTLLMFGLLLAMGHWVPGIVLAMLGGGVALCGFLPQATTAERAATNARRAARNGSKGSSSGVDGKAVASGGGIAVVLCFVALRIVARAARQMDGTLGAVVAVVGGVVLLGIAVFGYIKLGRLLGFYPVTAGSYLGLGSLVLAGWLVVAGAGPVLEIGDEAGTVEAAQEVAPFNVTTTVRNFPDVVGRRTLQPGVEFAIVRLTASGAGHSGQLYVYTPAGTHPRHSLPCVLIAPAGAPVMVGMGLAEADQPEHVPYVQQGFAVVSYEVDGPLRDAERASDIEIRAAYDQYRDSCAGLINARNALEFVLAKMPEVNPERVYTAGHSSAGRQALLLASHEPRFKGCVSYAGVCNVPESARPFMRELKSVLPGVEPFLQQSSPSNHVARINCPVFLFHSRSDSVVRFTQSENFAEQLRRAGKSVLMQTDINGDHYDSMIESGIPSAIQWLKRIDEPLKSSSPNPSSEPDSGASELAEDGGNPFAGGVPESAVDNSPPSAPTPNARPSNPPNPSPPNPSPPNSGPPSYSPPTPGPPTYPGPPSVPRPPFPRPNFPRPNFPQPNFPQPPFPRPGFPGAPGPSGTPSAANPNQQPADVATTMLAAIGLNPP